MKKKRLIFVAAVVIFIGLAYIADEIFKERLDEKFLTFYYALLISLGVVFGVLVWLLMTIRELQGGADEELKTKVLASEKLLKILKLGTPELKPPPGGITPPAQEIQGEKNAEQILSQGETGQRMKLIRETYAHLKELLDLKLFLNETKVKDILPDRVITIKVDEPFNRVPQKFNEFKIRHLPVVDQNNKLVGLITQRDLYRICSPRKLMDGELYYDDEMLNHFILEKVMVKNPVCMRPKDCLGEAVVRMVYSGYGCLPVVDHAKTLVGLMTRGDVLKLVSVVYLSSR